MKKILVLLSALTTLSGCGLMSHTLAYPIVQQYANQTLRGYTQKVYTVKEYNEGIAKNIADNVTPNVYVDKPGHLKIHLISTYYTSFKNGLVVAPIRTVAVEPDDSLIAEVGDVVEFKTGYSVLEEPGKTKPVITKVVCRKKDPDFDKCWDDPKRGGTFGIVDPKTGKAHNVM